MRKSSFVPARAGAQIGLLRSNLSYLAALISSRPFFARAIARAAFWASSSWSAAISMLVPAIITFSDVDASDVA